MVDVLNVDNQASDNQCRSESIVSDSNCPKCLILKEQLELITQELKSARTIISLLKDDIHTTPNLPSMDRPRPRHNVLLILNGILLHINQTRKKCKYRIIYRKLTLN